jgi:hypothetical protein
MRHVDASSHAARSPPATTSATVQKHRHHRGLRGVRLTENGETSRTPLSSRSMARLDDPLQAAARAQLEGTVEAYDAYLKSLPQGPEGEGRLVKPRPGRTSCSSPGRGRRHRRGRGGRPSPRRLPRRPAAAGPRSPRTGRSAAAYATKLDHLRGARRARQPRRRPQGPQETDTGFIAEVTNNGDQALIAAVVQPARAPRRQRQASAGARTAPSSSPQSASRMPIAAKDQVPLKPGETRTWSSTPPTSVPPGFTGTARLVATSA